MSTARSESRPGSGRARRWVGGLLLAAVSTLLVLGIAEAALRLAGERVLPAWGWGWSESPYRADIFPVAGQVNQLGLRGRPIAYDDDDFVVVIAGDSYTEAGHQPFEDMPERLLEVALRAGQEAAGTVGPGGPGGRAKAVKVFSLASAGWGQDQQLLALRRYFEHYRADLVIAWLTPVNDFWENSFIERSVTPAAGRLKPGFRLDAQGRLEGPRERHSELRLLDLLIRARASAQQAAEPAMVLAEREMRRWNAGLPSPQRTPADPAACPAREVAQDDLVAAVREGARALTVLSPEDLAGARSHFAPYGVPRSPREDYQIALTRSLLDRMAALSRAHGSRFAAFYPRGSDIDRALAAVRCVREQASGRLYAVDLSDPLAPLTEPPPGFPVIAPIIASAEATTLSSRDWHLNRRGNEIALAGLAAELQRRGLLSPR